MKWTDSMTQGLACWVTAVLFVLGLLALAVRLRETQVVESADYSYSHVRQSVRRVQTDGLRGRILDRHGAVLAENRPAVSIVCQASAYQGRTREKTRAKILAAIDRVGAAIGCTNALTARQIDRHLVQTLPMPLAVWRDVDERTLARFCERADEFPGFACLETTERTYPMKRLAAHVLGYVGRDRSRDEAGDEKFSFYLPEMRGRSGLEAYYDGFLRGVPGERKLLVDARGFAQNEWTVVAPGAGPDLWLTLDAGLQGFVERQLAGLSGACAVIDPRTGEVLALASAPGYDPNRFVPILRTEVYERLSSDPAKPLLNRASGGAYAPGSTFKPITALAGLSAGFSPTEPYVCFGVYELGPMALHCSRRWGHGEMGLCEALRESFNPYFCNLGVSVGTNALLAAARAFGLGAKTGLDLGVDMAGTVPDAEWKMRQYHERWYVGDLAQMSIGQGMLLASPLQMACVAGAIGTGRLVTPHLKRDVETVSRPLPFAAEHLRIVREGLRMVVDGGTGRRGGEGVSVAVSGKTGTAEVGRGERRRKNTWFIAYAPSEAPSVAVAMVIENGESGGGTTAPKVCEILKYIFNDR